MAPLCTDHGGRREHGEGLLVRAQETEHVEAHQRGSSMAVVEGGAGAGRRGGV